MSSTGFISKAIKGMETAVEWLVTAIVAVMVINISLGIFFRYVLNNALFWTEEMSRYLMIWAGMLGAALAMKDDSHVGISFVVGLFPPAVRRVLQFFARLVVSIFLAILLLQSFEYLGTLSIQRSSAMELPMVIPYLSVTAGAVLMSIENIVHIVRLVAKAEKTADGE